MILKISLVLSVFICFLSLIDCDKGNDLTGNAESDTTSVSDTSYHVVRKPNMYIYPQENINLDVSINFPNGGSIITSVPEYNNGWHIAVDSTGLINKKYRFLFYESDIPNLCQFEKGWIVNKDDLPDFFLNNLKKTGFSEDEINDFLDYWIPKLNSSPNYVIYPQYSDEIEKMIQLHFSIKPDNIIRLFYEIKKMSTPEISVKEPKIPAFSRNGFTVVEWGVIFQ